jgi:hypothetical protein
VLKKQQAMLGQWLYEARRTAAAGDGAWPPCRHRHSLASHARLTARIVPQASTKLEHEAWPGPVL